MCTPRRDTLETHRYPLHQSTVLFPSPAIVGESPFSIATTPCQTRTQQITDKGAIEKIVDDVMTQNPEQIAGYSADDDWLFGFFVAR